MFVQNKGKGEIVEYNCGFGVSVSLKSGEIVEIKDERAVKNLIRLLSPLVEIVPEPKKVKVEVKKVKISKPEKIVVSGKKTKKGK